MGAEEKEPRLVAMFAKHMQRACANPPRQGQAAAFAQETIADSACLVLFILLHNPANEALQTATIKRSPTSHYVFILLSITRLVDGSGDGRRVDIFLHFAFAYQPAWSPSHHKY